MKHFFPPDPGTNARWPARPRLEVELLEDRLAPGDLMGGLGGLWLGQAPAVPDALAPAVPVADGLSANPGAARAAHLPVPGGDAGLSWLVPPVARGNQDRPQADSSPTLPRPGGAAVRPGGTGFPGDVSHPDPLADVVASAQRFFHDRPAPPAGTVSAASGRAAHGTELGGQLYVSTVGDNAIKRINPAGRVRNFVTSGLSGPVLMDFDHHGNIFVANFFGNSISKIRPNGAVSTFASVNAPIGVQFDAHGTLYVSSPFINTISKVSPDGTVTPFVTSGLNQPLALVFDRSGNLYVTNAGGGPPDQPTPGAGFVTRITPDGTVSTIAAGFTGTTGLIFDAAGILYVASRPSNIDKVSPDGTVAPFVRAGLNIPADMTFGRHGVLYVGNEGNGTISKVTPDGVVSTFITGLQVPQDVVFRPRS